MNCGIPFRVSPLAFSLSLALAGASFSAQAGQDILIDSGNSPVNGNVYGNGTDPNNGTGTPSDTSTDGNTVTIESGGSVVGLVYGGYGLRDDDGSTTVTGNQVIVNGGTVGMSIYGGYASSRRDNAVVTDNSVTISGGTVGMSIYGGYATGLGIRTYTVTNNTVTISASGQNYQNLYGGFVGVSGYGSGDLFTGNTLNLAAGNTIVSAQNFENINFTSAGDAGIATLDTTPTGVSGAWVKMNTNNYNINFDGVISGSGDLNKIGAGRLTLTGTNTYIGNTAVSAGTLQIGNGGTSGSITSSVIHNYGNVTFNRSDNLTYSGIITSSGSLTKEGAGILTLEGNNTYTGGTTVSDGTLMGNTASLQGNIVNNATVYFRQSFVNGAYDGNMSGTGMLIKNGAGTVTLLGNNTYTGGTMIEEGTLKAGAAGALASGEYSLRGGAMVATLDLNNFSLTMNGERALYGEVNDEILLGTATLTVNTSGSSFFDGVISGSGDLIKEGAGTLTLSGDNTYTGETVVSSGTLELSGALTPTAAISDKLALYHGTRFALVNNAATPALTRLSVHGNATYTGDLNTAGGIMNFYVPTTMGNSTTMLSVSGDADITDSTVNVGIEGSSSPLLVGDHLVLIDAGTLTGMSANTTANGTGMQGVTLIYDFTLTQEGDQLIATLATDPNPPVNPPITVNPQTKALSEGFIAGVALINQIANAVTEEGIGEATAAARANTGYDVFGTLTGGRLRYHTGSHVNLSSASLLTGFSSGFNTAHGRFTLGAFLEAGNGNYDTHNSFTHAAKVKGDGDLKHYGIGALGKMAYSNGAYVEGSARFGRVENDFSSSDLRDAQGRRAKYHTKSLYYSLHAGGGYVWAFNEVEAEASNLDLYGKAFWTHQGADNVRLSTGDPVKFEAVDSSRLRIGGRYTRQLAASLKGYAGLAYEYEFNGKAKAATNGYKIDAPKLKGGTGVGELGLRFSSGEKQALSVDVGLQGYAGRYQGVTGHARVRYEF